MGSRKAQSHAVPGPTGVGKTVCALAVSWFGSEKALLKFDMSEQEQHTAARRCALPGYLGHDEAGSSPRPRRRPAAWSCLMRSKAHPDIQNILLQILRMGSSPMPWA
ncbi:MAG: AAA family ATPase [Faecalibacterium sp.]